MFDADETSQDTEIAFSRSTGLPPRLGKATNRVAANVPDGMADDWTRLSREVGMSESELLAWTMAERLYGREAVLSMQQERMRKALGIEPETVQKTADQGAGA
ncbi:MAG TPA: hypothetical protein VNU71_13360 [Burkholderiaceae bacterium]|nr:hypothetical protein [Burkholderiaceae bacterium]